VGESAFEMFRSRLGHGDDDNVAKIRLEMASPWIHPRDVSYSDAALVWSAIIASERLPKATGDVACEAVSRSSSEEEQRVLFTILGRTKTSCAAVDAFIKTPRCDDYYYCAPNTFCSFDELMTDTNDWANIASARELVAEMGQRMDPFLRAWGRSLIFAAHARGPLPAWINVPRERSLYRRAENNEGLCNNQMLEAGVPCKCGHDVNDVLCKLDPTETYARSSFCSIRIDDENQRVEVTRACEPEGAKCTTDLELPCCLDLYCDRNVCKAALPPP
jgi:hypothetical protein